MRTRPFILLALLVILTFGFLLYLYRNGERQFTQWSPVCHQEIGCARGDFDTYFQVWKDDYPSQTTKLKSGFRSISTASLQEILGPAPDAEKTGIRIHFGLGGSANNYQLELALEVVQLDPQGNERMFYEVVDNSNTVWVLNSNPDLSPTAIGKTDWRDGQYKTYLTKMAVTRNKGGAFHHMVDDFDHRAVTYRLKDINDLLTDNNVPLGTVKYIKFSSIANPMTRGSTKEEDWRHWLALIALNSSKAELLGTPAPDQPVNPYTMKALDLGSPCPPSCILAVFHTYGLAPRTGCECP